MSVGFRMSINVTCTLIVYLVGIACQLGHLPWFVLPLTLLLVFSRWAFSIHSRLHAHTEYPWYEEMVFLLTSPFNVGLLEHKVIHAKHHAFIGTERDLERLFYDAHPLVAFCLCLGHPEITFWRALPWMKIEALGKALVRGALFGCLWLLGGTNFLFWYFLPMRLLWAVSQFMFTWVLHHQAQPRTINLVLPDWLTPLVGTVGMKEFASHAIHHAVKRSPVKVLAERS